MIIMLMVIIDAIQFSAIGPDFTSLSSFAVDVGNAVSVDLKALIEFKEGVYWTCLTIVIILCFVWAVLSGMIIEKVDIRFERFSFCKFMGIFAENLLPIIGNVCFLPIIHITLDVFTCTEAVGDSPLEFEDSILDRDCHVECWQGDHIAYVTFGSIGLALFVPLAVYTRPLW
jgi:hypothetical protein